MNTSIHSQIALLRSAAYVQDNAHSALVASLVATLRNEHADALERRFAIEVDLWQGGLDLDRYRPLVDALVTLEPCPFSGEIETNEVIVTLGEAGNIWPASIEAAAEKMLEGAI